MSPVRVFTSYDVDHDRDLHDRLLAQSLKPGARFEIATRSETGVVTPRWEERVRRRICQVDEVVVICGEHTGSSERVSAELRIAREEGKPYVLLWGRRECMCTKPGGAGRNDSIYGWTGDGVEDQILAILRNARPPEVADRYKRPG